MHTSTVRFLKAAVLGWAIMTGGTAVSAQSALDRLEAELERLQEEVAILQQEIAKLREKQPSSETNSGDATRVDLTARGLTVESPDRQASLRIRGTYQVDNRTFFGEGVPQGADTMLLRRIRPTLEMRTGRFSFRFLPEFAGTTPEVLDAYGTMDLRNGHRLRFGKMKSPVGLERLQSASAVVLAERGLPTELLPNRDIGLVAEGSILGKKLEYAAGLFNGSSDGGSLIVDSDNGKELVARLFARPWRPAGSSSEGLGFGLAGTFGNRTGSPRAYATPARSTFFRYASGVTVNGRTRRLSPQLFFYSGSLGLLGELAWSTQTVELQGMGRELTNSAWQLVGSYVLTGENASYAGVVPRQNFSLGAGSLGALEVAFRVGLFRADPSTFPRFADPASSARTATGLGLGLNWYLTRNVRALIDYETLGFELPSGTRPREHALTSRLQIAY